MSTVMTVLVVAAGILIGYFAGQIRLRRTKPDGLLNVDVRDPDKDYYDFVFLIPTVDIPKKRFLKIEVFVKDENTQGENS